MTVARYRLHGRWLLLHLSVALEGGWEFFPGKSQTSRRVFGNQASVSCEHGAVLLAFSSPGNLGLFKRTCSITILTMPSKKTEDCAICQHEIIFLAVIFIQRYFQVRLRTINAYKQY